MSSDWCYCAALQENEVNRNNSFLYSSYIAA